MVENGKWGEQRRQVMLIQRKVMVHDGVVRDGKQNRKQNCQIFFFEVRTQERKTDDHEHTVPLKKHHH